LELVGPTLNILMIQTGVSLSKISTILMLRGAGYMSGNLGGALIEKVVKKFPEGLLSLAFLIASIG
jgi:predicted MFS family arabinose efflux permease